MILFSIFGFKISYFITKYSKFRANPKGSTSTIMYTSILFIFTAFCVVVIGIKWRLKKLNENLEKNLQNEFKIKNFIKYFSTAFDHLKIIVDILNDLFSIPFAIFISTNLLLVAFLIYDYYALYAVSDEKFSQLFYCLFATVLRIYMFGMVLMTIYCFMAVKAEEIETMKILYKFSSKKLKKGQNLRIWNLIHQIELSKLSFSCGMFAFDWKLLFKVS